MTLIVIPVILSATVAMACLLLVLTSPRTFRRRYRRLIVAGGLFIYVLSVLFEAPRVLEWNWGPMSIIKWLGQSVGFALVFWLMVKFEKQRTDVPEKSMIWERH